MKLSDARADQVGEISTFRLDPSDPAFARDAGWDDAFDDLRVRPRKRGERVGDWRRAAPVRRISFEPPVMADGRDASDVVQVHLEHRLVRRLLSRFLSQGFQKRLSRVSVVLGPGAQPRIVVMGRLAVFGPNAARLHEEILPVAAVWTQAGRDRTALRALGESGQERTLNQLEEALRHAREAPASVIENVRSWMRRDLADLVPALEDIAEARLAEVRKQLAQRGEDEAKSLASLLEQQRNRIAVAAREFNPDQLRLDLVPEERRERESDKRHWEIRLNRLQRELETEPRRLREAYAVRAHRLEPVGVVYLWPVSG
jgi:hypothetical protein